MGTLVIAYTATAKVKGVMAGLNTIWNSKQISYKTKLNVLKHAYLAQLCMLVRHGQLKRLIRIRFWPLKCTDYRRMLHLNWTMKVTNKEVRKRLNKNRSDADNNEEEIGTIWTYMQNGEQQKNKKCDVGNYGWEGKTWKT